MPNRIPRDPPPVIHIIARFSIALIHSGEISPRLPQQMPSLRTFRVEFDRAGATYAPGDLVTGNVIVDLAREKTIRGNEIQERSTRGDEHVPRRTRFSHRSRPIVET